MKRSYTLLFCVSALLIAVASCDSTIHEYPDQDTASVTIDMFIDIDPPQIYRIVDYSSGTPETYTSEEWARRSGVAAAAYLQPFTESRVIDPAQWDLHLVWEIYNGDSNAIKEGNARLIRRRSQILSAEDPAPGYSVQIDMPEGEYTLLAWADYTPAGTTGDYFYDTSNMEYIYTDIYLRKTCPDNDQRDSFAEMYEFTVPEVRYVGESQMYTATLTRPQGSYVVLAADYAKYLELTDRPITEYGVALSYPSYVGVGYSVVEERTTASETGLEYSFVPRLYTFDGEETVCIAYDYSFVNKDVSHVQLDADIRHTSGARLIALESMDIPLYADKLTVVIGDFLTGGDNSGGIIIDEGFGDEEIIEY